MNNSMIHMNDFYSQHLSAISTSQQLKIAHILQQVIFHMLITHFTSHAIDAQHTVKYGIAAVTWYDVTANHRRAPHSIPHFTFRILPIPSSQG